MRVFFGVRYGKKRFDKLYARKIKIINRTVGSLGGNKITKALLGTVVFFQDLILFAAGGIGVVLLNFYFNKGSFRIYTIAALFAGFVVYYFTAGKIVMFVSEAIAFYIKAAILITGYIISRPFVFAGNKIFVLLRKIQGFFLQILEKKRDTRYNKSEKKNTLAAAKKGFYI